MSRAEADFTDAATVVRVLDRHRPTLVTNTAAYAAVDQAEQGGDRAVQVNAIGPAAITRWCRSHAADQVHMSTDYVFSGRGAHVRRESDVPGRLNGCGASTLEGERLIALEAPDHQVIRASRVFDASGRNFLTTMMRRARERDELSIVPDHVGAPTFAGQLAGATLPATAYAPARPVFPAGICHLCAEGDTSWHGFAERLFAEAFARQQLERIPRIRAIRSELYPAPARRPLNSRLDCANAARVLQLCLPQ